MIILRQKIFFSEEFYKTWEKKGRKARRGAFYKTLGDAALGGVKNAGIQTLDAIKHPFTTSKNVLTGVGGKMKSGAINLGATFGIGIGKEGRELNQSMKPSERVRRQIHFWSPTARKAINIHDFTAHTLGKSGKSWVDSMAKFKYTPLAYVGRKTDEAIRTGAVGIGANIAGKTGHSNIASGLEKTQNIAGGRWMKFNADQVAGLVGKSAQQLNPVNRGVINFTGKVAGYTIGERPSGFVEEVGKAVTKGKEQEIAKQIESFKNTKTAKRAAEHLDRSRIVKAGNKAADLDRQLWGKVGQGINKGTQTILSGIKGAFRKQPTYTPAMI